MNDRPLFSIGDRSVVSRMRNLTSDVPLLIRDQATTKVEEYLLDQASFSNQQSVITGEVLDKLVQQTTLTNGRVLKGEQRDEEVKSQLSSHNDILKEYQRKTKKWRQWQIAWQLAIFPFLTAILVLILEVVLKHFKLS